MYFLNAYILKYYTNKASDIETIYIIKNHNKFQNLKWFHCTVQKFDSNQALKQISIDNDAVN